MNIRWIKQNLVVIIFLAVATLFTAAIVYLERQAASRKQQVLGELEEQQQRLDQLRKGNPPPSPENLQTLKRDREQLQQLYKTLQDEIGHSVVETPKMKDEIEFGQLMRETFARLEAEASRNHVKTPDGFAYGFNRYGPTSQSPFPCRNPPAKPEDCQRLLALLVKQLLVVERLSKLAMTNGVDEIVAVHRTEVEPGSASTDALAVPLGVDPKALYHTYPFELQFACSSKALQRFLNSLTQSDWFFAVKMLKVNTEASPAGSSAAPEPARTAGAPGGAAEKPPETRRLVVTTRIDLIEFPGTQTKPEKKAALER